jgi:uncharacterized protein YuzE
MIFTYSTETDSLYIYFIVNPTIAPNNTSPDFIVDIDDIGRVVGLEIINVKNKIDFNKLIFNNISTSF